MKQGKIDPEAVLLGGPAGLFVEENIVRWHIEKHPKAGPPEIGFINSIPIEGCPRCGCPRVRRFGRRKDVTQTFQCLDPGCRKRFNPLTNTIFDSRKIPLTDPSFTSQEAFDSTVITLGALANKLAADPFFMKSDHLDQFLRQIDDDHSSLTAP